MNKPPKTTLPDGVYRLKCTGHHLTTRFGRGSLELKFAILDLGPHVYQPVSRYYKVVRTGKRAFKASKHSDFSREFAATFFRQAPTGLQAVQFYQGVVVEGRVGIVEKAHDQKPIPLAARYSVVRQINRRLEP